MKKRFPSVICVALALIVASSSPILSASDTEKYTYGTGAVNNSYAGLLKPSQIEAMYPMSAEAESSLVHVIPECPVIVDGVWFKAEDIILFNGQRLRFTVDKAGQLYAFATAVGLEKFVEAEYGKVFDGAGSIGTLSTGLSKSEFFVDMWYRGAKLPIEPGMQVGDLGGFENAFSSAKICDQVGVYIYEYADFGGSYFYMPPGSTWSMLTFQGWNDRASSIIALG
ncbi:conserved hypothetical protein [Dehalogenimonas lykanthroporepellens BL-DC-9]|nr:conserved hypothetical protein [Dehalogenimonas lykanthroporepellens BL-DC-9]